jgi:hexosaminidase
MKRLAPYLLVLCALGASGPALMPMPASISLSQGKLVIDGSFAVRFTGYSDARLERQVSEFTARVSRQTGIPILGGERAVLTIECRGAGPDSPTLGEDESYQLDITREGAQLAAPMATGVLRGLETFRS